MESISFVVFTYNSSDIIIRNLQSLKNALISVPSLDYEIILIDNNSNDKTINTATAFAESINLTINVISNPKQGLVYSRILGVENAIKNWVCFIDDDNFLTSKWIEKLLHIIDIFSPDVVGGRTVGITDGIFPDWWIKNMNTYACGEQYKSTGFLNDPLQSLWGAGLCVKRKLLKQAITSMEFILTGRIGNVHMAGEDTEICYRLRLLGAKFYYSNELIINHYMREKRLNLDSIISTLEGFKYASVYKESYEYLLKKSFKYNLIYKMIRSVFTASYMFVFRNQNNFKYFFMRIKTLKNRIALTNKIKKCFYIENKIFN